MAPAARQTIAWLDAIITATPTGDCVEWPYGRNGEGYGQVKIDGRKRLVTHLVLEAAGRPRPPAPGDNALHSCDNPPCCNRTHLRWGTKAENMREMVDRGRWSWGDRRGSAHHLTHLTEDDVAEIRRRCAGGELQKALAAEYGLAQATVSDIVHRRTWSHVTSTGGVA